MAVTSNEPRKRPVLLDPRELARFDATGAPRALCEQIGLALRAHRDLKDRGELPTDHFHDPVGVEDQKAFVWNACLANAWLSNLAKHLPVSERVRIEMELVSPFSSPTTSDVGEDAAGQSLPEPTPDLQHSYLQQPWLRIASVGAAAWELRLADVWRRRTVPFDKELVRRGGNHSIVVYVQGTNMAGQYIRHARFRTRLWWAARLGSEAVAHSARLQSTPPPRPLQIDSMHCSVSEGVFSIRIDLGPGHLLKPEHVALLLDWLWPDKDAWAAGAQAAGAALPSTCFTGWMPQDDVPNTRYHVPDEEEMQRIEAWAAQVRRETEWARWTSLVLDFFRPPMGHRLLMMLVALVGYWFILWLFDDLPF